MGANGQNTGGPMKFDEAKAKMFPSTIPAGPNEYLPNVKQPMIDSPRLPDEYTQGEGMIRPPHPRDVIGSVMDGRNGPFDKRLPGGGKGGGGGFPPKKKPRRPGAEDGYFPERPMPPDVMTQSGPGGPVTAGIPGFVKDAPPMGGDFMNDPSKLFELLNRMKGGNQSVNPRPGEPGFVGYM